MATKRSGTAGKGSTAPRKGATSKKAGTAGRQAAAKRTKAEVSPAKAPPPRPRTVKMSVDLLPGPTPGRRTISDEAILEIVRDVMRKRPSPLDA